ncbi:MAG: hypothetical protein ABW133_05200, partial [Polyangiaceae bacterium]
LMLKDAEDNPSETHDPQDEQCDIEIAIHGTSRLAASLTSRRWDPVKTNHGDEENAPSRTSAT